MKKLPVLAGCILLLLMAGSVFAQQEQTNQTPSPDSISEIKGKTKFFLIAGEGYKTILKLLTKKNTGLQLAAKREEADFVVEFIAGGSNMSLTSLPGEMRYSLSLDARLVVYYMSGANRVPVWDKVRSGTQTGTAGSRPGPLATGLQMLAASLTKRFLNDLDRSGEE